MTFSSRSEAKCFCISRRLVVHFLDAITIIFIVGLQGLILNVYMINHIKQSSLPYFYFLGDMLVIIVFSGTLTISYRYLTKQQASVDQLNVFSPARLIQEVEVSLPWSYTKLGVMPFSYISWLLYVFILTSKVIIIFKAPNLIENLRDKDCFGPNILKVTIALTSVVFLSLAEGHNWSKRGTARYSFVTSTCAKNGIEIFDAVVFLSLLMEGTVKFDDGFKHAILSLSIVVFFLPAFSLFELSLMSIASEKVCLQLKLIQDVLRLTLVDLPFLAARIYLWIFYEESASLFLMKNVLSILLVSRTLYPDLEALAAHLKHSDDQSTHPSAVLRSEEEVALNKKPEEQVLELEETD